VIFDPTNPPPCSSDAELFYSPAEDGREEVDRVGREALAGMVCVGCPGKVACLYQSLLRREYYGVWGGMGEGERRAFRAHLIEEGYGPTEIPRGKELESALVSFYFYMDTADEKFHGYEVVHGQLQTA
jgi:hypothetical protein